MSALWITCFGDFKAYIDGHPIHGFDTDKTRALLAYLAVENDRTHSRSHLAGLLWSDQPNDLALHSLRQALSCLRKVLGETPNTAMFLEVDRNTVRLCPESAVHVDVHDFEIGLAASQHYTEQGDRRGRLNPLRLRSALELHGEPFLDQLILEGSPLFDEWASLRREQLLQLCVEGLARLAEFYERRREYDQARQVLRRILRFTPWDENAHTELMRLLALDNQVGAALTQYKLLCRYLHEHLDVEPSSQSQALFETIRAGGSIFPRYPSACLNLPQGGLPFVGRVAEMASLADEISNPECRLLTLLGPGGAGKTRLALETARQLAGAFPDGVFFGQLREASDAGQMLNILAEALEFKYTDQGEPITQLGDFFRYKNLLLVMDNFEQLLADSQAPAFLAELLSKAPAVTFLITSRQRLHLRQESIFEIDGLSLLCENMETPEALELFTRRARQVKRNFTLDSVNRREIEQICRLLDGLPLGIELAAASLWRHSCTKLVEAVQHNLDILNSDAFDAEPHHASLRAVFEVSWRLLNDFEQHAFARLVVFRGGFDADAAQQVAKAGPETLDSLVDKSLLRRVEYGRYDLHETLRQYAAEKMATDFKDFHAVRETHANYYIQILTALREKICGVGQAQALEQIQRELDNARLAWDMLIKRREGAVLVDCAEPLYQFFSIRSRFLEGADWFGKAAAALEEVDDAQGWLSMLLSRQGVLLHRAWQHDESLAILERSRLLLAGRDERSELGFCLIGLGGVHLRRKEFELALQTSRQAQDLFELTGSQNGLSYALYLQGLILNRMGNFTAAEPLLQRAVDAARQSGNPRRKIAPLNLLGDLACIRGDYAAAELIFAEALESSRQLGDRFNLGILVNNLATVYHLMGRYELAENAYRESLSICHEQGDRDGEALALNNLGELAVARRQFTQAEVLSQQALAIAEELGEEWTIIVCLYNLGEAASGAGAYTKSLESYRRGAALALKVSAIDQAARIAVNAARALQLSGEKDAAIALLQAAVAHPATEQAERRKALEWLIELGAALPILEDASLLEVSLQRALLEKSS